jgi:cytosolic carboxypeptidase protein 4
MYCNADVLQRRLKGWQEKSRTLSGLFFLSHKLTRTLGGLALPLLTITGSSSFCETSSQVKCKKELVVLTGRVHPSESNASYVIDGILESLLNESVTSKSLLQNFVFKIIPMLNPDGVVCGNWRCSLAGLDLNRQWADPAAYIVPTIFHAKNLMERWKRMGRRVYLYVDCHGHSNEKNVFFYGCSPLTNWHQPNWDNNAECIINLGQPKHKPVLDNTTVQHFVKMDIAAKVNQKTI